MLGRVILALFAAKHINPNSSDLLGISIFGLPQGKCFPECKDPKYKDIMEDLFWNENWYKGKIENAAENMIVERPALAFMNKRGLFATSFLAIGDSLNWYVEASVLNYPEAAGISLPDVVFQRTISAPFEEDVCSIFRNYGFIAGKVTDKGVWNANNNTVNLKMYSKTNIPGEIDVLAYDKKRMLIWVCECKVLSYPFTINRMQNILSKLDTTDDEGFHRKLESKTYWLKHNGYFKGITRWNKTLVLDRATPEMKPNEDFMALDMIMLEDAIKNEISK